MADTIETQREELRTVTEKLKTSPDAVSQAETLVRNIFAGSQEALRTLRKEINDLAKEIDRYTDQSEEARRVKEVIRTRLMQLQEQVGTAITGTEKTTKKWYEKLFSATEGGIVGIYRKFAMSAAFSMGGILKQIKESGFKWAKFLLPGIHLIGMNRVELASALSIQGIEGVDTSKGSIGKLIAVHKRKFASVPLDTFFAQLAKKTRDTFPGVKEVSFDQLADVAESMGAPASTSDKAKTTESPTEAAPKAPEVQPGALLGNNLNIAGATVGLSADGVFTCNKAGSARKWKLKNGNVSSFSVRRASVINGGELKIIIESLNPLSVYTGILNKEALIKLVGSMASSTTTLEKAVKVTANDTTALEFNLELTS